MTSDYHNFLTISHGLYIDLVNFLWCGLYMSVIFFFTDRKRKYDQDISLRQNLRLDQCACV